MPLQVRGDERVAYIGKTGSGKTFAAAAIVSPLPRLMVLDPKGTLKGKWGLRDWTATEARALKRGEPVRVRIPAPLDGDWEPYFKAAYEAGSVCVYIDEVYGVVPPGHNPSPYFTALYTRGRELGIGVHAATQRPSKIPLFVLSEAEWTLCFRLQLLHDRKRMQEVIGSIPDVSPEDPHGFYLYHASWDDARYYRRLQVADTNPATGPEPSFWQRLGAFFTDGR